MISRSAYLGTFYCNFATFPYLKYIYWKCNVMKFIQKQNEYLPFCSRKKSFSDCQKIRWFEFFCLFLGHLEKLKRSLNIFSK